MKDHKTIRLTNQRAVIDTYCAQPRCRFKGKLAQQGICFSEKGDLVDFDALAKHEAELLAELQEMRKHAGPKGYLRALEAHYLSAMMNWQMTLDECIRLRRDVAVLRLSRKARKQA